MSEVQKRVLLLRWWLTRWLGKSASSSDDWFCRSAAMAYQHFVDLMACNYDERINYYGHSDTEPLYTHAMHVEFKLKGGQYSFGDAIIDLNPEVLRISLDSHDLDKDAIPEYEISERIEMNWRTDEKGLVRDDYNKITEQGFEEVLNRFDGGVRPWCLKSLQIIRVLYHAPLGVQLDEDHVLFSYYASAGIGMTLD